MQPDTLRSDHRDAITHQCRTGARLPDGFGLCELLSRVDAENVVFIALDDRRLHPLATPDFDGVGQVEFALRIRAPDTRQEI